MSTKTIITSKLNRIAYEGSELDHRQLLFKIHQNLNLNNTNRILNDSVIKIDMNLILNCLNQNFTIIIDQNCIIKNQK